MTTDNFSLATLRDLVSLGGGGSLALSQRTTPADPTGIVAGPTTEKRYLYNKALIDGELRQTIVLDTPASAANRAEQEIADIRDNTERPGHDLLSTLNSIAVTYSSIPVADPGGTYRVTRIFHDFTLAGRLADTHIRSGVLPDGSPFAKDTDYTAAINATPDNLAPVLRLSPVSVLFGYWNSLNGTSGVKSRALLRGSVVGLLAGTPEETINHVRGWRLDATSPKIPLDPSEYDSLVESTNVTSPGALKLTSAVAGAKKGKDTDDAKEGRASNILAGNIGAGSQGEGTLRGHVVTEIIRANTISLSALRALRFGTDTDNTSIRAMLLAFALFLDTSVNFNATRLRTGCDLNGGGKRTAIVDGTREFAPLTEKQALDLLTEAVTVAGIGWNSTTIQLTGSPILASAIAKSGGEE